MFQFDDGDFQFLWYREDINSNAVIAHDLDGNGLQDLLLNTSDGVLQLEALENKTRPLPPAALKAVPLDTSLVRLTWQPAPSANSYRIYRKSPGRVLTLYDSTAASSYEDNLVSLDTTYTYAITQVNLSLPFPESLRSNQVEVRPNSPPGLVSIETAQANQLLVNFSEPMADAAFRGEKYWWANGAQHPVSAARGENRLQALLSFQEAFQAGANQLLISGITDIDGTPLRNDSLAAEFFYQPESDPLYLAAVQFIDKAHLILNFNRALDIASAENAGNYRLEPDNDIVSGRN